MCYSDPHVFLGEAILAVTKGVASALSSGHLSRYREILSILMRFGLSDFVENLGRGRITAPRISPAAARTALASLGPAFIKLGQILSTREELLPQQFRDELAKLQDQVPPFPVAFVNDLIVSELGAGIETVFARFEPEPLASGSIGQVHRAALPDGTEVVVKVQRPGIDEALARDSAIIRHLSDALSGQPKIGDRAARLVSEFLEATESELDYAREADQLERFAWQFEHEPGVRVPRPVREFCTRRVLTMTYVEGTKLSRAADLPSGLDRAGTARRLCRNVLKQVFAFGYFHGDPHPSNVFVQPCGSIGFYDLGLIGELSRAERESLAALLLGLLEQDADAALEALTSLTRVQPPSDLHELRDDISRLMVKYFQRASTARPVHRLLAEILDITSRHGLVLPNGFYLAFKVLATIDTLARGLDPEFDLAELALPALRRAKPSRSLAQIEPADALDLSLDALAQLRGLPAALRTTFGQLNQGQLRIQFEHRGLDEALTRYEDAGSRLSAGMLASSIALGCLGIVGLAVSSRLLDLRQAAWAAAAIVLISTSLLLLLVKFGRRVRKFKR